MDTESVGPWTQSLQSKQTSCLQGEDWWQNPSQWDYRGTTGLNRIAEPPSPVTYLYKGASGIIRMADKYHTPISDKHGLQCHRPLQYSFTAVRVKDTFSVCVWFQNHEFASQRHFYYVCDSRIMNRKYMLKNQNRWPRYLAILSPKKPHLKVKVNGSKQPWPLQLDVCIGFLTGLSVRILLNSIISLHGVSLNYCTAKRNISKYMWFW